MARNICSILSCICLAVIACGQAVVAAETEQVDWTRTSMRPLPQPSDRPLGDAGVKYFVDGAKGKDDAQGTQEAPWKTIAHGLKQLDPGDTLVLRAGTYYESLETDLVGTKKSPITLRAHPGELVVLDGGYREFFENPESAWEPFPAGGPGEYRSKKVYPDLGAHAHPHRDVYVLGNLGESMVPLHGYNTVIDLRTDSMFSGLESNMTEAVGMYVGPGVWYDARAIGKDTYGTKRIHIRLAHTSLDYLGAENNYTGETDPRKLKLVIGGPKPVIKLNHVKHLRLQDLVLRGSSNHTLQIDGGQDIELDGLTVYGGAPALRFMTVNNLRVLNCAFRGVSAPWSSRYAEKYRGVSTYILEAIADSDEDAVDKGETDSREVEIANCEFSDCHDGLEIHAIKSMKFHHNWVDRFNDDGIEPGPRKRERHVEIYNNRISRTLLTFSLHGGKKLSDIIETAPGSGVYVFRNVIDLRAPTHTSPPPDAGKEPLYAATEVLCTDHGSPTWENYYFYQNTVIYAQIPYRNFYAGGFGGHMYGTKRWVFNNIFLSMTSMPAPMFDKPEAELTLDGNLCWCLTPDPKSSGDFFAKFRASETFKKSQQLHPPGWAANDLFADPKFTSIDIDWHHGGDLTLQSGSPAIDAGVSVPAEWSDSLRKDDRGKPDIGAFPQSVKAWGIGVRGRYSIFGELLEPSK